MKKNTKRKLNKLIAFCKDEGMDISADGGLIYVTVGNGRMNEEVWCEKAISGFSEVGDFGFNED